MANFIRSGGAGVRGHKLSDDNDPRATIFPNVVLLESR